MVSITPQVTGPGEVAGGVDTHQDTHTAAAVDAAGRVLGTEQFPATAAGYVRLLAWLRSFGTLMLVGIEGTGAYAGGLARQLHRQGVPMIEVDRPDRKTRRWQGKSDPVDAIAAARAALAQHRTGIPKQRDGQVEALRNLRVARRSAVDQRADAQRQIKTLIVTAPDQLRIQLRSLNNAKLVATCAAFRPDHGHADQPETAARLALRSLAPPPPAAHRRNQRSRPADRPTDRTDQPRPAEAQRRRPPDGRPTAGHRRAEHRPAAQRSRVRDTLRRRATASLLRPHRPTPPQPRRRPPRQLRPAPHRAVPDALGPRTRDYVQRRTQDGMSKKEIIRCLKRYLAREVYRVLVPSPQTPSDLDLAA